jgi:hypothetical protein
VSRLVATNPLASVTATAVPGDGVDLDAGSLALTHRVVGLVDGVACTFQVAATNDLGAGDPSPPSDIATPRPDTSTEIPTLGAAGLALLVLVMMGLGGALSRRRS